MDTSEIDAIVTWVDGNDPAHLLKRTTALAKHSGRSEIPIAAGRDATRFQDNGELLYCLASIRKFAPWMHRIHLITDNQIPEFLTTETMRAWNINIVDHRDIFKSFEWALPTFNSRSIETAMCRIPGLARRFIYLNDDFLFTRYVDPDTFFSGDMVVLRGSWQPLVHYGRIRIWLNRGLNFAANKILRRTRTMHLLAQMRAAHLAGFSNEYFRSPHIPHPLRTETLTSFFERNPNVFADNIGFPFRDMAQYWPISLANHLEIMKGNVLLALNPNVLMINGERDSPETVKSILASIRTKELDFLCLGSLERLDTTIRRELDKTLIALLDL